MVYMRCMIGCSWEFLILRLLLAVFSFLTSVLFPVLAMVSDGADVEKKVHLSS